jgi:hypothetical protein
VLRQVDEYEQVHLQYQNAEGLVRQLSDSVPGGASAFVLVVLFLAGCGSAAYYAFGSPWQRTTSLVIASLILSLACYRPLVGLQYRLWFAGRLIPEAEKRNLDPVMLVGLLSDIGPMAEGVPRGMQAMADRVDRLVEAYLRRGPIALSEGGVSHVDRFVSFVAPAAPTYTGCFALMGLMVVGAVPGLWWAPTWGGWVGLGIGVATVVVAFPIHDWLKKLELRAWVAQTLIPAMDLYRVGTDDLLRTLKEVNIENERIPAAVRRLAQCSGTLRAVLGERRRNIS